MNDSAGDRGPGRPPTRRLGYLALCVLLVFVAGSRLAARGRAEAPALTIERMALIHDALDRYAVDNGGMIPSTSQGLRALLSLPAEQPLPRNWCGPYLEDHNVIFDGWGRKFNYVAPGGGPEPRPYDLWSLGADNAEGGGGAAADIKSWEPETLNP